MSTQKEEHHSRNVSSAHPQCRHRPRQEGSEGRRQRKGIHTMGEKINAICLSHHAFPKYISALLSPRQKLYWGTLSYCPMVSPSSPLCSPNRTSLQSSTVYINVSHFSCKDFKTVHNFNKRKLLFCSAYSGKNTRTRTLGGTAGVSYWHSKKWLDSQSVCPPKDYCCH